MNEKNSQMNAQAEAPAPVQVLTDDELAACAGGATEQPPLSTGSGPQIN